MSTFVCYRRLIYWTPPNDKCSIIFYFYFAALFIHGLRGDTVVSGVFQPAFGGILLIGKFVRRFTALPDRHAVVTLAGRIGTGHALLRLGFQNVELLAERRYPGTARLPGGKHGTFIINRV